MAYEAERAIKGLKMPPIEAMANQEAARQNLEKYWQKIKKKEPKIFSVGDHVRLREDNGTFAKGHVETFSQNVYKVSHVFPPSNDLKSSRYGLAGIRNKVFTYNDLLKTAAVTVSSKGKKIVRSKDRLQKQAAKKLKDLWDLKGKTLEKWLQSDNTEVARKPRGDVVYIDVPMRKKR
ncbi:hypothetical protein HDV00_011401 [Rhizophlyctis rosea]|nr:hypothetical protein HDV00_011401 [Rhizophlyctis rosea]